MPGQRYHNPRDTPDGEPERCDARNCTKPHDYVLDDTGLAMIAEATIWISCFDLDGHELIGALATSRDWLNGCSVLDLILMGSIEITEDLDPVGEALHEDVAEFCESILT